MGQYEVRLFGDHHLPRVATLGKTLELLAKSPRIDHHPAPQHRGGVVVEHAAGQVVELKHVARNDDRVSGVRPPE